jgi:hypothetical protein
MTVLADHGAPVGVGTLRALSSAAHLVVTLWFPYRRWFLFVFINLSSTFAVRAVLVIIYPATAISTRTSLHCRHLSC